MKDIKVTFMVDGKRTEEYVTANGGSDVRKIIEKRFCNCKVVIINVQDVTKGFYCW